MRHRKEDPTLSGDQVAGDRLVGAGPGGVPPAAGEGGEGGRDSGPASPHQAGEEGGPALVRDGDGLPHVVPVCRLVNGVKAQNDMRGTCR